MKDMNEKNFSKDVEIKSIKIIPQEDTAPKKVKVKRVELDGKQKMEISLKLSQESLDQIEAEKKLEEAKKKREKKELNKKIIEKKKASETTEMPEFMLINVGVVLIVSVAIMLCLYLFERTTGVSDYEKRELATFPTFSVESYFDGSFTQGITTYFTDTVPNRENLKSLCNKFKGFLGVSQDGQSIINSGGSNIKHEEFKGEVTTTSHTIYIPNVSTDETSSTSQTTTTATPTQTTPEESTTTTKKDENNGNNGGESLENGILVINKGTKNVMAMELYGGGFKAGEDYANILNSYKKDLAERLDGKVNVYSMCIPMAVAFYLPDNFKNNSASITDNILNINSHLDGVISIDAYNALKSHTDEYIYSRTDHHWQPIGAYYAAQEFAETAMVDFPDISQYEQKTKTDFVGTLYGFSGESELLDYPDTFTYYVPQNNYTTYNYNSDLSGKTNGYLLHEYASGTNTYSMFLGDDKHVVQVDTDVKNSRTLVVFKDSFGNALIPFLTSSFEHIYVVDYRYCDFNAVDFCVDVGATDVLFATSMFTNTSSAKVPTFEENRTK